MGPVFFGDTVYIVGEQNCVKLSDTARTYSETCWNRSTRSARVLFVRSSKSVFVFFRTKTIRVRPSYADTKKQRPSNRR